MLTVTTHWILVISTRRSKVQVTSSMPRTSQEHPVPSAPPLRLTCAVSLKLQNRCSRKCRPGPTPRTRADSLGMSLCLSLLSRGPEEANRPIPPPHTWARGCPSQWRVGSSQETSGNTKGPLPCPSHHIRGHQFESKQPRVNLASVLSRTTTNV